MSLARVIGLQSGIRYQAKSVAGVLRTLSNESTVDDGESLVVKSSSPRFGQTVCSIQNKVSGVWTDALALILDVEQGTSHARSDKLSVDGNATNSTVSIELTYGKGHLALYRQHVAQIHAETSRGIVFDWAGQTWDGVMSAVSRDKNVEPGGYMEGADARLVANRKQFVLGGVMPVDGNKFVVDGETLELVEVEVGDVVLSFELRRCNSHA